jgi:hypothetical protein
LKEKSSIISPDPGFERASLETRYSHWEDTRSLLPELGLFHALNRENRPLSKPDRKNDPQKKKENQTENPRAISVLYLKEEKREYCVAREIAC